jgi:signal transduction histidine kinase
MAVPAREIRSDEEPLAGLALAGIPAGVMVLDSRGQVLFASAPAAILMGGDVQNVATDTLAPEDFPRQEVLKLLRQACESGEPVSRLVTFDRECRHYIQVSASPLREDGGEKRTAVLVMDLTSAVAQGDMVKEFVRQIRHDLRGPLTSMRGAVDLLMTERLGPLDEKQKKLLNLVEKATHQMTGIVSGGAAVAVSGMGQGTARDGGK